MKLWRHPANSLALLSLMGLAGCHSAFVQATVTNHGDRAIRLFEVDYPSASFGSQDLQPGKAFRYRFKVIGDGPLKLSWTDSEEKEHSAKGPTLHEGEEGTLGVAINNDTASWQPDVHPAR